MPTAEVTYDQTTNPTKPFGSRWSTTVRCDGREYKFAGRLSRRLALKSAEKNREIEQRAEKEQANHLLGSVAPATANQAPSVGTATDAAPGSESFARYFREKTARRKASLAFDDRVMWSGK